jgi:hypothetical protein
MQETLYLYDAVLKVGFVGMHQDEVIHISSVLAYSEILHYKNIQFMEIDIRKNLTGEISQWQPCSRFARKKGFASGETIPLLAVAYTMIMERRVIYDDGLDDVPQPCKRIGDTRLIVLKDGFNQGRKDSLIYRHKVTGDIIFSDPCFLGIIIANGSKHLFHLVYRMVIPFPYPAGITIIQKKTFKNRIELRIDKMMYDTITDMGSKDFSWHRIVDKKTGIW